jgi:hypothetical protein
MRCPPSWTSTCKEIEHEGGFCKVSVTLETVLRTRLQLFITSGRARVRLGRFRSNTIHSFPFFSFSPRAKEILENGRKMLKMQDQFCQVSNFL